MLNFKKNAWGRYALLPLLLLCTVTISRFSSQRLCDTPIEAFYRFIPRRMKSSIGVSLNSRLPLPLWLESPGITLFKIRNPPVCDATGDSNHRSFCLRGHPAARWCTGSVMSILRYRTFRSSERTCRQHVNPKKAHYRRILNLKIVTVHRRSDSRRAYRP